MFFEEKYENKLRNYWKVDSGDVSKISMENNNGVVISTLTTGATLQEFLVPTETGALKNIVLGFSDYEDYYKNNFMYLPVHW